MSYLVKDYQPPTVDYVAGKYRIVDTIGIGNLGTVFEAEHAPLDHVVAVYRGNDFPMERLVAVKTLHPHLIPQSDLGFGQRFDRLMRILSTARHPNIVTIHDWGFDHGTPYIVMPYLAGARLRDIIAARAPLPIKQVWEILKQTCAALSVFHSQGIYHLGLSPENILLNHKGANEFHVQVFDLGISGLTPGETKIITMDDNDGIVGIPRYTAPEQVFGYDADARSDIYALGAMLYDMIVGKVPFTDDLVMQTTMSHLNQYPILEKQFTPDVEVPDAIKAVILKSLDIELRKRFQSVIEFMAALMSAIEGVSIAEALVQVEELLKPPVVQEPVKRLQPLRFPSVRRRRLIADIGFTLVFGTALCLSIPFVLERYDRWTSKADQILHQEQLLMVLPLRREVQGLFERANRERKDLDKTISELRAGLAQQTGKPLSSVPAEQTERIAKLEKLKFELDIQEELLGALSSQVLSRSPAMVAIKVSFERAETFFRDKKYDLAQEAFQKIRNDLVALFARMEKIQQVFALKQNAGNAAVEWLKYAQATKRPTDQIDSQAAALREAASSAIVKTNFDEALAIYQKLQALYGTAASGVEPVTNQEPAQTTQTQTSQAARNSEDSSQRVEQLLASGDLARTQLRYTDAIKDYKAALELQHENAIIHNDLGDCYLHTNRLGEAVLEFKEAIRIKLDFAPAYYNLGKTYALLDRYNESLERLREAARLAPSDVLVQLSIAEVCERAGDSEGAKQAYREVLKIDPENKAALKAVGGLKRSKGKG